MKLTDKIFVAGYRGLTGSAIVRKLLSLGYENLILVPRSHLDLRNQADTERFFEEQRPDYVFLSAAKVGGIGFNREYPADFLRDNLLIQTNVIDSAYRNGCKKLLFMGSACAYPKDAPIPVKEDSLLTSELEPTNISYALAKIAGYLMCRKYTEQFGFSTVSLMPNNIYGINDNFNLRECHVIPSLIRKFVDAKERGIPVVTCFGDGTPIREFLFSDDMAEGAILLMNTYEDSELINIGPKHEVSIKQLSSLIAAIVGYEGEIFWDISKPNGTPRRVLDTSKMDALGWTAKTSLEDGLSKTLDWYLTNRSTHVRL